VGQGGTPRKGLPADIVNVAGSPAGGIAIPANEAVLIARTSTVDPFANRTQLTDRAPVGQDRPERGVHAALVLAPEAPN
jgi:hypothetical protein